jgi:hypothetical protein
MAGIHFAKGFFLESIPRPPFSLLTSQVRVFHCKERDRGLFVANKKFIKCIYFRHRLAKKNVPLSSATSEHIVF